MGCPDVTPGPSNNTRPGKERATSDWRIVFPGLLSVVFWLAEFGVPRVECGGTYLRLRAERESFSCRRLPSAHTDKYTFNGRHFCFIHQRCLVA